jgi:hypothetical protein
VDARLDSADRAALSRRALLLALHPDGSAFAHYAQSHAERVDWAWALRCARAHKVAALLAARIEQSGVGEALAADVREQVTAVRRDASRHSEVAQRTLATVAEHFGRNAIPFFVVKGSVLAQHVYGDPSLRRFADVDLVVHRRDVDGAEAVLRSLGFVAGGIREIFGPQHLADAQLALAAQLTRRFDAQRLAAFSWYAPRGSQLAPVDLHWHIAPYRLHIGEEKIWAQTTAVDVGGTQVLTLNGPATLIHLALHATTCLLNGFRMLHLCDIAWTAARRPEQQDAVWQLAAAWGLDAHLAVVFAAVERALGIAVPIATNGHAGNASNRLWARAVTSEAFLLQSTELAQRPALARAWSEFVWSYTMGCLRRNIVVVSHVSWARLRLRLARRLGGG